MASTQLLFPGVQSVGRKSFLRGTHRLVAPEETVARVQRLMPAMGITRLANVTGLDTIGIPVVMACRPNSRSIAVSQGKGLDLAAAKASALMESVEAYHAEHITLPLKLASYEELRYTHPIVDVDTLLRPADGLFDPNSPLLWIEGHDLIQNAPVWLPYELAYLNYTLPLPPGAGCFVPTSNGLASGNHLLEATSHGLCEVVERDAVALWSLKDDDAQSRDRIDLNTVDDPACRELLERFARAGVSVAVWDVTSDIGIPTFFCLIADESPNPLRPVPPANGSGCHPTREVALARSLSEAAQSRLTYIAGSRDDLFREDYALTLCPEAIQRLSAVARMRSAKRDFRAVPTRQADTFRDDVVWILGQLQAAGITSAIAVNLTREEFGLPVVRIVVPTLELADPPMETAPGPRWLAAVEGQT